MDFAVPLLPEIAIPPKVGSIPPNKSALLIFSCPMTAASGTFDAWWTLPSQSLNQPPSASPLACAPRVRNRSLRPPPLVVAPRAASPRARVPASSSSSSSPSRPPRGRRGILVPRTPRTCLSMRARAFDTRTNERPVVRDNRVAQCRRPPSRIASHRPHHPRPSSIHKAAMDRSISSVVGDTRRVVTLDEDTSPRLGNPSRGSIHHHTSDHGGTH